MQPNEKISFIHQDMIVSILQFLDGILMVGSCSLVSKEWLSAVSLTKFSLSIKCLGNNLDRFELLSKSKFSENLTSLKCVKLLPLIGKTKMSFLSILVESKYFTNLTSLKV